MTMAQMGLFDLSDRYASLDGKRDPVVEIDAIVPWEEFRPLLDRVWRKPEAERKSRTGPRLERSALNAAQSRHAALLAEEERKLDRCADDLKIGLEREIREIDRMVADARRLASASLTLEQKLEAQKSGRSLEQRHNQKRKSLFEAQDEIDIRRGDLIAGIEARVAAKISKKQLFMCGWRIE